jgi:hypothetical protein
LVGGGIGASNAMDPSTAPLDGTTNSGLEANIFELDDKEIFSRLKRLHAGDEGDEGDVSEGEEEEQQPNKEIKLEEFRQIDDDDDMAKTLGSPIVIQKNATLHSKHHSLELNNQKLAVSKVLSCHVYCGDNALEYKDFDISKDRTMFTQEYSWGEQCFALANHYLPNTGEQLDQQFNTTYYLTYETFSKWSKEDWVVVVGG